MTADSVAQRFAFDRPGYRLVDFAEVGLPVYRLSLLASFLEVRPLPALHEFVLRSTQVGLTTDLEIAGYLGLDLSQLVRVLADLDSAELISVGTNGDHGQRRVNLTSKGIKSVAQSFTTAPKLGEIVLHFDGLTRRLLPPRSEPLWQFRQLTAAGIREIGARPPRRPTLSELSTADARHVSNQLSDVRGRSKRQLLAIKAIERSTRMFQVGHVLLYHGTGDLDVDFSVVVDGMISSAHKDAIIRAGGLRRFGIDSADQARPPELSVIGQLSDEQRQQLELGSLEVSRALEEAVLSVTEKPELGDTKDETGKEVMVRNAISEAMAQIRTVHIRYLEVFEHPPFLDEALEGSKQRLLIISPWIKRQVLDAKRLKALRQRLEEGCRIYIGWGIGKGDRGASNDIDVVSQLQALDKEFQNFYFLDMSNTHEKVLIKDSDYVITTSFNWLSFRGDPKRTLRYERGVFIAIPELVNEQFELLSNRFEDSKQQTPSVAQLDALKSKFSR